MVDFTLSAYQRYIELLQVKFTNILRFDEFYGQQQELDSFCLIRHDVDRRVGHSLAMAKLEYEMGVKSTYYFRTKSHVFKPEIIQKIAGWGHEIGYHYENLSDFNGDMEKALEDFEIQLNRCREISEIKTIAMHGSALKGFDNRDLWRVPENHALLKSKFDLLGEAYLDIDYTDICYITDTGRNWTSTKSNIRDKVHSNVPADFESGEVMAEYFANSPHPKIVFQIHPERYSLGKGDLVIDWSRDQAANVAKKIFALLRQLKKS